jgi:hypothetical protein
MCGTAHDRVRQPRERGHALIVTSSIVVRCTKPGGQRNPCCWASARSQPAQLAALLHARHTAPYHTPLHSVQHPAAPTSASTRPHHCAGSRGHLLGVSAMPALPALYAARGWVPPRASPVDLRRMQPNATRNALQQITCNALQHITCITLQHIACNPTQRSPCRHGQCGVGGGGACAQPVARSTLGRWFAAWRTRAGLRAAQWSVQGWACPLVSSGTYTVTAPVGGHRRQQSTHAVAQRR